MLTFLQVLLFLPERLFLKTPRMCPGISNMSIGRPGGSLEEIWVLWCQLSSLCQGTSAEPHLHRCKCFRGELSFVLPVCRRPSVPSEVIFVVKAGLHHRGKSFRDQPKAIFAWAWELQQTQWVNLILSAGLGVCLADQINMAWVVWGDHFSCLGGDEETMGVTGQWGWWEHRGQGGALVLQGLCAAPPPAD